MDFCDLDTSLKVTMQNVTLYSNWLFNKKYEIEKADNRSNYITSRIGFVESNPGAIISFLKKTGLITSQLEVSPLACLIAKEELNYQELCIVHLSKESLFLGNKPIESLLTVLCKYIDKNIESIEINLNEVRTLDANLLPVSNNYNSNNRNDYIITLLEGTGLFVRKGRMEDGMVRLTDIAKPIIEYFLGVTFNNCIEQLNSANRFNYFSSIFGGIFDNIPDELPKNWEKLYPHLNKNNYQKIKCRYENSVIIPISNFPLQQIFYGAPGTGKSHEVKIITGELDDDGIEHERSNVFRTTFHPDTDYATFIGCYKPTMAATRGHVYSQGELINRLTEIKRSGVTYPVHKFSAKYWDSIEKLSTDEIKYILSSCGFTESMNVEVSKGLAVGQELAQNCDEQKIIYSFVPQAFTDAYVYAYNHPTEPTYLVIEEINRGNCAQIFGDLFQLLDRKEDGTSEYAIKADKDLAKYLLEAKTEEGEEILIHKEGIQDGKLRLPRNLNILATMNTSDQSLFPMDSAFKRRWDWQYVAISYTEPNSAAFTINVGEGYRWVDFIRQVNKRIFALTQSEDKELGNFFIKSSIDAEQFKSKVMFYLWYEVLRDDVENSKYFFYYIQKEEETGKETTQKFTFKDLYGDHADIILNGFLQYISKDAE